LGDLAGTARWNLTVPFNLTKEQYLEMKCDKRDPGLKKIIPTIEECHDVLIYHACPANVYTASKRDCIAVIEPEEYWVSKFQLFFDKIFIREIEPLLNNFTYDYNAWFNGLDSKQQKRQLKVDKNKLSFREYKNFCKKEKQEITDPENYPKNRNICGPNEEYKYVMGPVVHMLEQVFKRSFKGYTSGKNWADKERSMNKRRQKQLRLIVEGDGKGFDRTQYNCLKYCEFVIYQWLADHNKIHHVTQDIFLAQALCKTVLIRAINNTKVGKFSQVEDLGYYTKEGSVQTGNMDTTFANTLRMAMYNRFVNEIILGLQPEDYDLDAAGDDFTNYLPTYLTKEQVSNAYYTAFANPKQKGKHGLGQILKFLKFSDIEDIDFCSTECFYDAEQQSYKILRKLDRFITLTPWSQKALAMSREEQYWYMMDLWEANNQWIGDLPIYKEYNDLLKSFANKLCPNPPIKKKCTDKL